jgi:response regulator RpfG family c-di-GMP phosphodiesterase
MSEKILCVDDEPHVLQAYERALRKQFAIETALGGEQALDAVQQRGPYAVVVADMRMPGMNGVQLLARIKALAPDTVRMMLTGNADQQTALEAVNEGQIFRFMTKPCPPETFAKVLQAGIEQYRLITAERELLSKTLCGSVRVLTDVLSVINPAAFGRASRLRRLVRQLCDEMKIEAAWQIEIAAMLSQIGCVSVPEEILAKAYQGKELTPEEQDAFESHPKVARKLLANIPRMEQIAEIVAYQEKYFDGGGFPADSVRGQDIPLGSRLLKVAIDWDMLQSAGLGPEMAMAKLVERGSQYDPEVLAAMRRAMGVSEIPRVRQLQVSELVDGMILADDVKSMRGTTLCAKGQEITPAIRFRLKNYVINVGLARPISVFASPDEVSWEAGDGAEREIQDLRFRI